MAQREGVGCGSNGKRWRGDAQKGATEERGCARRGMVRREERRSWQMREEMGEATPNGVTGRTQVVAGREERRMVGEEERKSWQVQDGRRKGGTVRREARWVAAGIGMESGRYRNGKRRQRDAEWCNADMVQEERRSWQVQDGRVEAEWCYGKSAGLRQVQEQEVMARRR